MNENKKIAWLYVLLTTAISAVAVIFRHILDVNYVDPVTGFYSRETLTPDAFTVFLAVAVALIVTSAFMFRRDLLSKELKRGTVFTAITSVLCAVSVVFSSLIYLMGQRNSVGDEVVRSVENINMVGSIVAFAAAIYYFAVLFSGKSKAAFVTFLSFFPVIWTLFRLMPYYIDHSVAMNSPVRILKQLALILLMLYQLFETRAMLGRSKPRIYFVLANLAVIFVSAAFLPEVVYFLEGRIGMSFDVMCAIYCGACALYVLSREIAFASCSDGMILVQKKSGNTSKPKDDLFTSDDDNE